MFSRISNFLNESFKTGTLRETLEFADITPTHKNENTMDKEDCRPVKLYHLKCTEKLYKNK